MDSPSNTDAARATVGPTALAWAACGAIPTKRLTMDINPAPRMETVTDISTSALALVDYDPTTNHQILITQNIGEGGRRFGGRVK